MAYNLDDETLKYYTQKLKEKLATKEEVPTKTSELTNDSGYLTDHQDISELQPKNDNTLTTTDKTVIGSINELNENKANTTHTHDELHTHSNKDVLDTITNEKITNWDNKSEFDGDYNSLTNKPTIPTATSQLTNDSNFLTEHQDISNLQSNTDNNLLTTDKTIVGSINELFQSVSNGKELIATAITDKGIETSSNDTFQTMADNISNIESGSNLPEWCKDELWITAKNMNSIRYNLTSSVVNGKIYCIGGCNSNSSYNVNEEYNPITNTWGSKADMVVNRDLLTSSVVDNKIYVIGGERKNYYDYLNTNE